MRTCWSVREETSVSVRVYASSSSGRSEASCVVVDDTKHPLLEKAEMRATYEG